MLDFQVPRISSESVDDNRGSFTIEPLDRGFGYTFGNSLRRVLLSSLAGAAVTSVRIEGVAHEFSTIRGVKEDVTDIVLNLKGVVCRMHSDATEIEAPLVVTGPGEITAKDIDLHAALREAAEILISQLAIFTDEEAVNRLRETGGPGVLEPGLGGAGANAGAPGGRQPNAMDDILIEELELGVRSYNCLKRAGIQTVGDLVSKTEGELNAIPNFGKKSIDEVIETLHARGLGLRGE